MVFIHLKILSSPLKRWTEGWETASVGEALAEQSWDLSAIPSTRDTKWQPWWHEYAIIVMGEKAGRSLGLLYRWHKLTDKLLVPWKTLPQIQTWKAAEDSTWHLLLVSTCMFLHAHVPHYHICKSLYIKHTHMHTKHMGALEVGKTGCKNLDGNWREGLPYGLMRCKGPTKIIPIKHGVMIWNNLPFDNGPVYLV